MRSLLLPFVAASLLAITAIGCSSATDEEASEAAGDALRSRADDPTGEGPNGVSVAEYKLPASIDPEVLSVRETELWASVHRPKEAPAGAKLPVLVFLHGNHPTCGTSTPRHIDTGSRYVDNWLGH